MKRQIAAFFFVLAVTIGVSGLAFGAGPKGYDPGKVYTGPYGAATVYYRESFRAKWRLGINGSFPKGVTCPDALSHFKSSGLWQGHLKLDGSCGIPDEPAEWAVGNRLNFGPVPRMVQ
jgi:hypothetical protein